MNKKPHHRTGKKDMVEPHYPPVQRQSLLSHKQRVSELWADFQCLTACWPPKPFWGTSSRGPFSPRQSVFARICQKAFRDLRTFLHYHDNSQGATAVTSRLLGPCALEAPQPLSLWCAWLQTMSGQWARCTTRLSIISANVFGVLSAGFQGCFCGR